MSVGLLVACMQPPRRSEPTGAEQWWTDQVVCVTIEEVPEMGKELDHVHYYALTGGRGQRILKIVHHELWGQPNHLVDKYLDGKIVAYTEQRQNFWSFQPDSWVTYHTSTIFEVDCPNQKLFILIERVDDKLEIMFGMGYVPRSFMLDIRATGKPRKSSLCHKQPRQLVAPRVTVRRLLEWMSNNLSRRWQPYHILHSNCQHVAEDLQSFVRDPIRTMGGSVTSGDMLEDEDIFSQGLCVSPTPCKPASSSRGSVVFRSNSSFDKSMTRTASFSMGAKASNFSSGAKASNFNTSPKALRSQTLRSTPVAQAAARCASFDAVCTGNAGCPSATVSGGRRGTSRPYPVQPRTMSEQPQRVAVKQVVQSRRSWKQGEQALEEEEETCSVQ